MTFKNTVFIHTPEMPVEATVFDGDGVTVVTVITSEGTGSACHYSTLAIYQGKDYRRQGKPLELDYEQRVALCYAAALKQAQTGEQPRPPRSWREYIATLTQAQRDRMLESLLEWQIDVLGSAGDVRWCGVDDWGSAHIYWDGSGEPLLQEEAE